ncbi:MAG TPA: hypothetical protein PKY87_12600 [Terricaulis sp.]|nr:hypothetical protein [Terricaulis sp.]
MDDAVSGVEIGLDDTRAIGFQASAAIDHNLPAGSHVRSDALAGEARRRHAARCNVMSQH